MSDGRIERQDGRITFRYERQLGHPLDVVWHTITDPAEIERWLGVQVEIQLRPGGRYISTHRGGMRVVDRITRLEPPNLFEHTFWAETNPGARVRWHLAPASDGCVLSLTHSLSVEDIQNAARTVAAGDSTATIISRNAAGWHHIVDKLAAALDGRSLAWSEEAQKRLRDHYAGLLD